MMRRSLVYCCILPPLLLLAGCAGLHPQPVQDVNLYLLDAHMPAQAAATKRNLVIEVGMPRALPGFDTPQMAYVQEPYKLDYFAVNRWADTPAHMLAPLLVQALEQGGGFRAVVRAPSMVPADLKLDTELVRLQQDFRSRPSRVELTLRVQLISLRNNRVLATRVFDETENAPSENPYGGVVAANHALQRILNSISEFCLQEAETP
jgi:cholesterol transport system auxiliary component